MSIVALAVDFGGTKVESALVTADGQVIAGSRSRAATGREASSEQLEASVRQVVEHSIASLGEHELVGVGIGTAGPVDRTTGTVSPVNVPVWRG